MLYLTLPTKAYLAQGAEYRAEFVAAGDSMDGTGPLRRIDDPAVWLRKTILKNGGVYEYTILEPTENENIERYWITL